MIELYYRPFACSLASRISLEEAGLEAVYHRVDLDTKRVADGRDFLALSAKGQVPLLRTLEGTWLSEGAAVLQYIADQQPASGLAPPPGDPLRYELQSWLNFIATELHKQFLFPQFTNGTSKVVRDHGRLRFEEKLTHVTDHLRSCDVLVGEHFSVADAYLIWVLTLARFSGIALSDELAAYLQRVEARPAVARAIEFEREQLVELNRLDQPEAKATSAGGRS
jgi:glutathione S-transferase